MFDPLKMCMEKHCIFQHALNCKLMLGFIEMYTIQIASKGRSCALTSQVPQLTCKATTRSSGWGTWHFLWVISECFPNLCEFIKSFTISNDPWYKWTMYILKEHIIPPLNMCYDPHSACGTWKDRIYFNIYTKYYYKTKISVALKVYHGINIYHIAYANPEKIEIWSMTLPNMIEKWSISGVSIYTLRTLPMRRLIISLLSGRLAWWQQKEKDLSCL